MGEVDRRTIPMKSLSSYETRRWSGGPMDRLTNCGVNLAELKQGGRILHVQGCRENV